MIDLRLIEEETPEKLSLDFVKCYLRVDHDLDDAEIEVALKSAISYVKKYIGTSSDLLDDDLIIPILTLVAHFYENKTAIGKSNERIEHIVSSILHMNREAIL